MRRTARTLAPVLALALVAAASATAHAQFYAYGLRATRGGQQLVRYNTANPNAVTTLGATGAALTGIDFRPADGRLYGFDGTRVYTLDTRTGAATVVGTMGSPTSTGANRIGFDFNPVPDRIRVIGGQATGGASYRYVPDIGTPASGTQAFVDGSLAYMMGDPNAGSVLDVTAVAYTNSDRDPLTGTQLFGVDNTLGNLVFINPPNAGVVNTVGSLGLGGGLTVTGFDIFTVGGANVGFFTALAGGVSRLYAVDFAPGAMAGMVTLAGPARLVGRVGAEVDGLALAAVPEPGTWALVAAGLLGVAGVARRRRSA